MKIDSSSQCPDPLATENLLEQINQQLNQNTFDAQDSELLQRTVEALADKRGLIRLGFVEAFGKIGKPVMPFLLEALTNHPNAVVRRSSAKGLAQIHEPESIPTLINALLTDEDTVVRSSAAGALARIGADALPALLEVIGGDYLDEAKGQASWALTFAGIESLEALVNALKSDNMDIRKAALEAILNIAEEHQDDFSQQAIISVLQAPELEVRLEAVTAVGRLPSALALPNLIPLLDDAEQEVTRRAIFALGKLGDPQALPFLKAKLTYEQAGIANIAKIAISQIENRIEEVTD